jgi:hypothetical protein
MSSPYAPDQEIHVGEDKPFEADYDPCADDPPDLTGSVFQFTATPIDGAGTVITIAVTFTGTLWSWTIAASDTAGRVGEVFLCQVRRTNAGSNRVWLQFRLTVVT